jgi:hypothetical protein
MKFINKTLYQIIFFCFIAESFSKTILIVIGVLTYKIIGFDGYKISTRGPLGCLDVNWQMEFMFFWGIVYAYTLLFASYKVSKKGFETKKTILIMIGSLLFFPMFKSILETIFMWHNPLWFLDKKVEFSGKLLPLFGNLYNLKIAQFISWTIKDLITIFVGFLIVSKFWNKELRIKFVTIGATSAIAGTYFWYYFLGKLIVTVLR